MMSATGTNGGARLRRGFATVAALGLVSVAGWAVPAGAAAHHGRPVARGAGQAAAGGVMSRFAGGVGGPTRATSVILGGACGVSYADGSVYVGASSTVRQVSQVTGRLTTPAGIGVPFQMRPPLGDRGKATNALLSGACGVAAGQAGNLVIADAGHNRIRVVAGTTGSFYGRPMTAHHIYTVAGDGRAGYGGDGGPGTGAQLHSPAGVAVDAAGNLVIADTGNNRIRVVAASTGTFYGQAMAAGDIYTVAGDGTAGYGGDGGPATSAELDSPAGVAVDGVGNLVIADTGNNRVRVVPAVAGIFYDQAMTPRDIYTVAGDGTSGFSGDAGPATSAELNSPAGVALDANGNLLIADTGNNRVRVFADHGGTFYGQPMTLGDIYTVAGDGTSGRTGDGGPATSAELSSPAGVAVDGAGNLLIADAGNNRVRVVAEGNGAFYSQPMTTGDVYTVAGTNKQWISGLGGLATSAEFIWNGQYPGIIGVAMDNAGNLVTTSSSANRVLVVPAATGTFYGQSMTARHIYSIAGDGSYGYSGDGGLATKARLAYPWGVAVDSFGNVLIAADQNNRIRVVAEQTGAFYGQAMTAGHIYTVAGDGSCGYSGDGGPATSAGVCIPVGVAVDSYGNLLVTDTGHGAIRVVPNKSGSYYGQAMTAGDIYTIAGDGSNGYAGDGGPATSAELYFPQTARVDATGSVVIADTFNSRIRVVAEHTGTFYGQAMTAGDIYTVAGDGNCTYNGTGIPATTASVCFPGAAAADAAGNLVISGGNARVRVVAASGGTFYGQAMTAGDIYTVAGNGVPGCGGDGGPATRAQLGFPQDVTINGAGDLLIGQVGCHEIRMVTGGPANGDGPP
jgi:trimeric autotransporter adhesin